MSILNGINFSFAGQIFFRIQIPSAILISSFLNNTTFINSNLSHVNFTNANLDEALFIRCNFEKAEFGKFPDLIGHSGEVLSVVIRNDNKILISGSKDKTIKVWNLENGEEIRTLSGHSEWVNSVSISNDG